MNVYTFQSGAYTGLIKGINGVLMQPPTESKTNDRVHPVAESCNIEIVESESFRVWKAKLTKEDLDGFLLTELPQVIMTIQNALDDNCTSNVRTSFDLFEEMDTMVLTLHFPSIFGRRSFEFRLNEVEQDKVSVLQKQVEMLRDKVKVLEIRDNPGEMKQGEKVGDCCLVKQQLEELCLKMDLMDKELEELKSEPHAAVDKMIKHKATDFFLSTQNFKEHCLELDVMKQQKEQTELNLRHDLDTMKEREMEDYFRIEQRFEELCTELDMVKQQNRETELEHRTELDKMKEKEKQKLEELRWELYTMKQEQHETQNSFVTKTKLKELWAEVNLMKQTKEEAELELRKEVDMIKAKQEELELEFRTKLNIMNPKDENSFVTKKEFLEFCAKVDEMKQQKIMEKSCRGERRFVACGSNLHISRCGNIVSHASGVDSSTAAVIGETMKDGKYYAEFSTVRMKDNNHLLRCGILPSTERNLNTYLSDIPGNYSYFVCNGNKFQKGHTTVPTGLPGCHGTPGPKNIGVKLDLDENKIQFFLNGTGSTIFDIAPGEYSFALSLYHASDEVKLIRIEKLE